MNKSKILRSLTVIPDSLYIERDADHQVRYIVEEMGRPGYVLVARQMGKTNLLLHAKRSLENDSDVFLYMDVSNPIPDIRGFFRSIIDVATGVLPEGGLIQSEIEAGRSSYNRLPHKEHENELRILLRSIKGRLVICLDEIDALSGLDYSDQVFTFIRSVYFAGRINFPDFNRLTYLLSGVAEPGEIIKNKDVSPFNIGAKIYLDDFTLPEVAKFLRVANIPISPEIVDRIYYWTSGHPRMTWDLCSDLEDLGGHVTKESVDDAVKRIYFGDVDLPPIDHIKKLVTESREIRDALIAIHYDKSSTISHALRTKLYLSGITGFRVKEQSLGFKNKIIEMALSESHLIKFGAELMDALTGLIALVDSRSYAVALPGLIDLGERSENAVVRDIASYYAGICYFWMRQYEEAFSRLEKGCEGLNQKQDVMRRFFSGVASWYLFQFQAAAVVFNDLMADVESSWFKAEVQVYLASCLAQEKTTIITSAEEILKKLESELDGILLEPVTMGMDELVGFIAVTRAQLYRLKGDWGAAAHVLELEIERPNNRFKADLAVRQLQYFVSEKNDAALDRAYSFGMQVKIDANESLRLSENLSLEQYTELVTKLIEAERHEDGLQVAKHVFQVAPKGLVLNNAITSICSLGAKLSRRRAIAATLFGLGLEAGDGSLPVIQKRELIGLVFYFVGGDGVLKYSKAYVETFENIDSEELEPNDILALYTIIMEGGGALPAGVLDRAYSIISRPLAKLSGVSALEINSIGLLRDFLDLRRQLLRGDSDRVADLVKSFRKRLDATSKFELVGFPGTFLTQLRTMLMSLARPAKLLTEKRLGRKIGRNEFVKVVYGNDVKEGKFKRFEADLASGLCVFLDDKEDMRIIHKLND